MTEYEQKWLSFLEEAKNKPEEDLNEYISDIINTAKSIASRAKGQGAPSPLSGLGRGNVSVKPEEEAEGEEEATAAVATASPTHLPHQRAQQDEHRQVDAQYPFQPRSTPKQMRALTQKTNLS